MLSCRLEQLYIPLFGSFSGAALVFMIRACSPVESIICRRVQLIYGYSYPQYVSLITDRKFFVGPPDLAQKCDPRLGRLCDACRHTMPASETSLPDISVPAGARR